MTKFKIKKLDNGITLLMCNDPSKHVVNFTITTKFGGDTTEYKKNNKKYKVTNGMAHFLEHYLIEYSKYGNAFQFFTQNEFADFNGYTTGEYTEFYIGTPHDYLRLIEELLEIVNKPVFVKENIESNKPAIIEEINKKSDEKFARFYLFTMNNVFQKKEFKTALGSKEDITNLKLEEVKEAYEAFYRPSNQIIFMSGCFDEDKVIDLINKCYEGRKEEKVTIPKVKEPLEVKTNYAEMFDKVHNTFTRITFKYPLKKYKKFDLMKLCYYVRIYLDNCFDNSSKIHQELVDNKVIEYDLSYIVDFQFDYLLISVSNHTLKTKEFIDGILKTINAKEYDKEYFEIAKNQSLINCVLREDNPHRKIRKQMGLYYDFGYKKELKAKDYDKLTFEEYKQFINELNFDNYCVTEMKDEGKK